MNSECLIVKKRRMRRTRKEEAPAVPDANTSSAQVSANAGAIEHHSQMPPEDKMIYQLGSGRRIVVIAPGDLSAKEYKILRFFCDGLEPKALEAKGVGKGEGTP